MAAAKIRLGIIGSNPHRAIWANQAHLPAILASPEFELTAVCTTRQETADEAARRYGARLAFHNYQDLINCSDIDAVAVVLRVPSHYQPTRDAINAGKHVFTEWPLGRNLAEAQELAELARARGVQTVVGLQARASPSILYLKDLVAEGCIGEVMSCRVSLIRDGALERSSDRTWSLDHRLGATTLTIATGHVMDALRFVIGDFSHVAGVVTTQAKQCREIETGRMVDVTAPDNILVAGQLANGGVASVHVSHIPWAGSGFQMEIYGWKGSLVATGDNSPQLARLHLWGVRGEDIPHAQKTSVRTGPRIGARADEQLKELPVPAKYVVVPESMPQGQPYNVGQLYHRFAQAIRTASDDHPSFDTAVEVHRLLDAIRKSSDEGHEVKIGS